MQNNVYVFLVTFAKSYRLYSGDQTLSQGIPFIQKSLWNNFYYVPGTGLSSEVS